MLKSCGSSIVLHSRGAKKTAHQQMLVTPLQKEFQPEESRVFLKWKNEKNTFNCLFYFKLGVDRL